MPIILRSVKGSNLTPTEIDGNFSFLLSLIEDLQDNPPAAISISSIQLSDDGSQMTVYLTNGTTLGPFTLPTAVFRYVGEWAPATGYAAGDFFTYERAGLYYVLQGHVSEATFDATETNSDGDLYQLVMELFAGSVVKTVSTTTYDPVLLDANRYLRCTNNTQCTVTIPTNASVAFSVDTELHIRQAGNGPVIIVGASGVTINPGRPGFDTTTPWKGANITLKKVATNTWDYVGPGEETT